MKLPHSTPVAVALLAAALVIGGTGGAIASGQIGTNDIRNGAVTTPKLHNNAVTSPKIHNGSVTNADLALDARGAKVVQYVSSGALFDSQDSVTVQLPGTWTAAKLAKSTWSVGLARDSGPTLFMLSQSANAGEGTADGFWLAGNGSGVVSVLINAPSYNSINTIRITRTIS